MSSRLRAPTTVKNPLKLSADAGNASTSTTTVRPVRPIATAVKRKATAVPAVSVAPALKRAALATRRPVAAAQSATENIPANVPPQKSVVTKKKRPAWDTKVGVAFFVTSLIQWRPSVYASAGSSRRYGKADGKFAD